MAELRLLQVITTTSRRGAEVFALDLHEQLSARGVQARIVALVDGTAPTLDVESLGQGRLAWSTLKRLRTLTSQASVVVAHGSTTLPACAGVTIGQPTPFIYRSIGDPAYWASSPTRRLRSAVLLRQAALVAGLSEETRLRLVRLYRLRPDKVITIPAGIDTARFPRRAEGDQAAARHRLGYPTDISLAVCIGALSPEKAVHNAVLAMGELPERWHLAVAGDGPDKAVVDRAASTIGGDRIRLLGQITDPAELLTAADLLVLPSLTEGIPAVVLEAASIGIPSVVTDVGFVAEIVDDGVSGVIVPPGSPAVLAAGILACEPRLAAMGQAAAERSGSFSMPVIADRWQQVISEVAHRSERRSV